MDASAQCVRCGYDLRGLSSRGRCPECGAGFDRTGTPAAGLLLPWERTWQGGPVRRTVSTIVSAWLHPRRFMLVASTRKDVRVIGGREFAGWFLGVMMVASLALWHSGLVTLSWVHFWRGPGSSILSTFRVLAKFWSFSIGVRQTVLPWESLFIALLMAVLVAVIVSRWPGQTIGQWRVLDIFVLLCPAVAALVMGEALAEAVKPVFHSPLILVFAFLGLAVWLALHWYFFRLCLEGRALRSALMTIGGLVLMVGVRWIILALDDAVSRP